MAEINKEICQSCNENPSLELHECPYRQEIEDDESLCDCCKDCIQNCADDI